MLTAEEAKKKTQSNIDNCATKELTYLEKQINKAVQYMMDVFLFQILDFWNP